MASDARSRPDRDGRRDRGLTRRDLLLILAIPIAVGVAYWPALKCWFVADDFFLLSRIKEIGGLEDPLAYFRLGFFEYYRPLGFLSQAVDWQLWRLNALPFHLTNLVLHAVNAVLVFVLARRLLDRPSALVAAGLFALHAANHEAVYWVAARFDLLATAFTLAALLCLTRDRPGLYVVGLVSFALGLLSKESALSLPVLLGAYDVFIRGRDWRSTGRRLAPVLLVTLVYMSLRSYGVDVPIAGGLRRLPKLVMLAGALAALLVTARALGRRRDANRHADGVTRINSPKLSRALMNTMHVTLLITIALVIPASSGWMREKLGFVTYVVYYLLTPVVFPAPPPYFLEAATNVYAIAGMIIIAAGLLVASLSARWWTPHARVWFMLAFVIGALLPVSSMTGGLRYLYLASAGVALAGGYLFRTAWRRPRLRPAAAIILIALAVTSAMQLYSAGQYWRWATGMSRQGLAAMSTNLAPCGTVDVVLLTTPVSIGGVCSNFYWESFGVAHDCSPASFRTLLRVVREDATVEATTRSDGVVELRVPNYRGQILMSKDLSTFDVHVSHGLVTSTDTPLGRLDTAPDGDAQIFRWTPNTAARTAERYYYSHGGIQRVE
jgi:dolichyl-phosphate-mannose-protein mannosyltransferase